MNDKNLKETDSLRELLGAVCAGDQDAFECLLERYRPLIDRSVSRFGERLYSEESREDMRQEAMAAFYDAIRSYRTDQEMVEFGLYAKVCIGNRLISHLRREQKQGCLLSLDDIGERVGAVGAQGDLLSFVIEQEDAQALTRLIEENLSEYENRVFSLYVDGRSAAQIAVALGREVRSIENAIARIRKKLRALLQDRL